MTAETFLNGRVTLFCGDSRDVLKAQADNSIDSVVCDPPYALVSVIQRFGNSPRSENIANPYSRTGRGFMGQKWDTGETAFAAEFWAEVLRVLKPGGHVVAFSGTRTYHRLACAIEDAGFEVRDMLSWLYGSGFPKSHDVSKGIDRANGDDRPVIGREKLSNDIRGGALLDVVHGKIRPAFERDITSAASAAWEGWGTALKPACEPICFCRKPLIGTVAANVLHYGTGAINIEATRVGAAGGPASAGNQNYKNDIYGRGMGGLGIVDAEKGRWPANVIHDGSDEVLTAFPDAPGQQFYVGPEHGDRPSKGVYGDFGARPPNKPRGDSGSAARFFYAAKADADDRIGSKHPTVKPVDLMQWLCRLITPPGGTILDPFAGTGTTGEAAFREGFNAVLIEREAEYQADIRRRMALCMSGPDERKRESIKARSKEATVDAGPLFGGLDNPPRAGEEFTGSSRTKNRADRTEMVKQ